MIKLSTNTGTLPDILAHLQACDDDFVPALSSRVDLEAYSRKILVNATRFEGWADEVMVGLVALYCDTADRQTAFITNVSVLPQATRQGLAKRLVQEAITHASGLGFRNIALEVLADNVAAIALYRGLGFDEDGVERLNLSLVRGAN